MEKAIRAIWAKWLRIGHAIGNFQGQVILTIFYFIFLWPLGIVFRLFQDPLNTKKAGGHTTFGKFVYEDKTAQSARKQY